MATTRERLTRFYLKYNGDKLHEIEGLLERFKGKETQLFSALVKKYGPEPSADEVLETKAAKAAPKKEKTVVDVPESKVVKDFNHARLLAFYNKYNPEKVGDVEQTLAKYKGKEAQLFNALVKKYGPEPDDSDDEDDDEEEAKPITKAKAAPKQEEVEEEEEDDDEEEDEEEEEDDGTPKLRTVLYCPIDTLPPEYCEYGPMFSECKPWLAEHYPELMLTKYNRTVEDFLEAERQIAAGVEGITLEAGSSKTVKRKKKGKAEEYKKQGDCIVYLSKSSRKGRKRLTFVTGLEDFDGVNIKDATKSLGRRFACSSSLSKTDVGKQQIQLQGDCLLELMDVLPEMFGVPENQIVVLEETKKK